MTAKEIPLEEFEKIIFEEYDSWFPNSVKDFWYRNSRYEYMIANFGRKRPQGRCNNLYKQNSCRILGAVAKSSS